MLAAGLRWLFAPLGWLKPRQCILREVEDPGADLRKREVALLAAREGGALDMLALLQLHARLLDFVHEDLGHYNDLEVAAAARILHAELGAVLEQHVQLAPVRDEAEGARVELLERPDEGSDVRLVGHVNQGGAGGVVGALVHRGWRAARVEVPQRAGDARVLAPAEVEVEAQT